MYGEQYLLSIRPKALDFDWITKNSFAIRKCVLPVLCPGILLPGNYPLLIGTNCALRAPGESRLARSITSWIPYRLHHAIPFLVDSSNELFHEFDLKSQRRAEDSLSVFSLLVNVSSKLQSAKWSFDDPILPTYANLWRLRSMPGHDQRATLSEMRTVLQRAFDGRLWDQGLADSDARNGGR